MAGGASLGQTGPEEALSDMPGHHGHGAGPMPYTRARHLLHPLRGLILSPSALRRNLALPRDAEVLEIGPGPGYYSVEIARGIPEGTLWLLDIQPEMLAMAKERLEAKHIRNVRYVEGDAMHLPFENGQFDAALLVAVLGELPDAQAGLMELHRVLRPGGLLSVTEQLGDPDRRRPSEVRRLLGEAGFKIEGTSGGRRAWTVNALR